jgi:hypothetical protein
MSGIIEVDSERGKQIGLTSDRFFNGTYLWDDENRVMISFVHSRAKGNFRSLVAAIHAEGKDVVVPTPLPQMERIVRKNGYIQTFEVDKDMGESVEIWTLPCSAQQREVVK